MSVAYAHGVTDVPLRGETIGEAGGAVAEHGSARRSSRARRESAGPMPSSIRGRAVCPRPAGGRGREGRPRRHLGAEPRRVGGRPVRDGARRRDSRQHQPGLPGARARVRAPAIGLLAARPRAWFQGCRLSRCSRASRRGRGTIGLDDEWEALLGRARPAEELRVRENRAPVRRADQHPVHVGHDRVPEGRDAVAPQHPQQRLLRRRGARLLARRPRLRAGAVLPLLRHGARQPRDRHARRVHRDPERGVRRRAPRSRRSTRSGARRCTACRRCSSPSSTTRPSPRSTSRRCGPGSWPARRARSR